MHIQRHVKLRADLQLAQASATIGLRLLPARLASIALDRLEVVAGETATGTVSLSNPAPEGGAVVTISEAGTAAGLVTLTPERATVAAGESTQSFSVAAKEVSEKTQVVIQAAYQGEEKAVGLDLLPRSDAPQIAAVELDRSSIEGGKSVTGQVRLSGPARETVSISKSAKRCGASRLSNRTLSKSRRATTAHDSGYRPEPSCLATQSKCAPNPGVQPERRV